MAAAGAAGAMASCSRTPARWRSLTQAEAELVDLISEQIIPSDEDPGARWAGVVNFIDRQLAGPYKRYLPDYQSGLVGVQETSREIFGRSFADLEWKEQTAVLEALESGKAKGRTWQTRSSSRFFDLVCDHCMQGFYGSPRHGGNRDYVSFRIIGLDYPQRIGQNRYKKT